MNPYQLDSEHAPVFNIDRIVNSTLANSFGGISPVALSQAFLDWGVHLALSPGKQGWLAAKGLRKLHRFLLYAGQCATGAATEPCIEPLPQDRRFADPLWQHPPFNLYYQAFLLYQQWWYNATTDVRGTSKHHENVVTFAMRQWLDMISPTNYLFTNPEALSRTLSTGGINLWQGAYNWWQDAARQIAGRKQEGADRFQVGRDVAVTPGKVVYRNNLIELIQYAPQTADVYAEPILIVPSWIMKYYILDLVPESSLVRYLVGQGHTVFMISWKNPDARDRNLGMDDYLKLGPLAAIDAVRKIVTDRKIHAVGYCLGGTLLAIAAAVMSRDGQDYLGTISLLASEVDFEEPGELSLFIDESQITYLEDVMWEQGYLDGKQMAGAFQMLNSRDLVWSQMVRDYLLGSRQPLTELMAWNADATRMPVRMHSEYLHVLYLNNDLSAGRYLVNGKPVVLSDIHWPMFVVGTERDHVSPWRSVYKLHLYSDTELTFLLTSGGHNVGIVNPPGRDGKYYYRVSTRSPDDFYVDPDTWYASTPKKSGSWWPEWQGWVAAQSFGKVAPPPMGAVAEGLPPLGDAPGQYVLG